MLNNEKKAIKSWAELGLRTKSKGQDKTICPNCSHTRHNKTEKCLSINLDEGVSNCHHCGMVYYISNVEEKELDKSYFEPAAHTRHAKSTPKEYKKPDLKQGTNELKQLVYAYLNKRGISNETLESFRVTAATEWMPAKNIKKGGEIQEIAAGERNVTCFNYYRNNELINTKFRDAYKSFKMVSGAELIFYNIDVLPNYTSAVICEGEIDCLSFYEAEIYNCVSVPNGASKNANLEYLDKDIELFDTMEIIYIATDNDEAGELLADELVRRLGRDKCRRIHYPEGCKDANDVLVKHGKIAVFELIANARPYPLQGIKTVINDLAEGINRLYEIGYPKVYPINLYGLDRLFKVCMGEFTIITGASSAGKSTLIDEILLRLAFLHSFKIGVLSFEKQPPVMHVARMSERYIGKSFFQREHQVRMSVKEKDDAMLFYDQHFFFVDAFQEKYSVLKIVKKIGELVKRYGINIMLIDPYNYINKEDRGNLTETEYVAKILPSLVKAAIQFNIHIFLVAHPTKNYTATYSYTDSEGKSQVMKRVHPNDLNGSVHFFNIADNIISVLQHPESKAPIIFSDKIRNQEYVGECGQCESIVFERVTGRYYDQLNPSSQIDFYSSTQDPF